jgi:hypothetical protein
VVVVVERLARDLLGRENGEVGDLAADLVERPARLELDLAPGVGQHLLARGLGIRLRLVLDPVGRLARAGDDVLGLLARLLQPLAVLVQQLVGLNAHALRVLDRLLDRKAPLVERLRDPRERQPAEDEQRDPERDQRPDHQPYVRADQEVAALLLLGGAALGGGYDEVRERDLHRASRPGRTRSGRR